MAYEKVWMDGWKDGESGGTYINAAGLNHMEEGIKKGADHADTEGNPHSTTAEQVGLGNVPNVSTNDQTPTYTAASALSALLSGEKLSAAFGKLAKAVTELISHIGNKNNPHEVTAEQTGAVPTSRTINGKALSSNITLTAFDVGAADAEEQAAVDAAQDKRLDLHEELINGIDAPLYRNAAVPANPVEFSDGYPDAPIKTLTLELPTVQSGSGDPSPDNIRPIVPYDAAGNLLLNRIFAAPANANGKKEYTTNNPYAQENSGAGYIPATGYFKTQNIDNWVFNDGTSNLISLRDGYIRFSQAGTIYQWKEWSQMFKTMTGSSDISDFVGKTYTFSALVRTNKPGYSALIAAFASGNSSRAFTTKTNEWELLSTTFTVPENANINWLRAGFSLLNTTIDTYMDVAWADLREGATMSLPAVTVFRNGEPAAVIAMSGGAFYGGTLNVATGLLTVTHYMAKIYESNPEAWVIQNPDSDNRRFLLKITTSASGLLAPEIVDKGSVRSTAISNCFKWGDTPSSFDITAADNLRIFDPISNARWPTVQDLMNTLNELGMIVVYPVASPMTYQLTPAELTTLPGYNSISCDAGSISALTYRADPALAYQALETTLTNAVLSLGANL